SIRSACFLSRSCSSARTFSSHFACLSATHLSTEALLKALCFLSARLLYRHCLHLRTSLGRFMAVICCYAIAEISSTRALRFMVSILQGDCRFWRQAPGRRLSPSGG